MFRKFCIEISPPGDWTQPSAWEDTRHWLDWSRENCEDCHKMIRSYTIIITFINNLKLSVSACRSKVVAWPGCSYHLPDRRRIVASKLGVKLETHLERFRPSVGGNIIIVSETGLECRRVRRWGLVWRISERFEGWEELPRGKLELSGELTVTKERCWIGVEILY